MGQLHEKRETTRVPIEIPIQVGSDQGLSRDISFSGIYFTINKPFEAGENLQIVFELAHAVRDAPVHLDCQGYVLRVEKVGQEYGIAAVIEDVTYLH
jgi:hypothetical protein